MPQKVLFVVGAPASGKGVQCKRLVAKFPQVFSCIYAGGTVSKKGNYSAANSDDDKMLKQIKEKLESLIQGGRKTLNENSKVILIEGYPSSQNGLRKFKDTFGNVLTIVGCLHLNVSELSMQERIVPLIRRGHSYYDENQGHATDKLLKEKYQFYSKNVLPVVNEFKKSGNGWEVDAENPEEVVFQDIVDGLKKHMPELISI